MFQHLKKATFIVVVEWICSRDGNGGVNTITLTWFDIPIEVHVLVCADLNTGLRSYIECRDQEIPGDKWIKKIGLFCTGLDTTLLTREFIA